MSAEKYLDMRSRVLYMYGLHWEPSQTLVEEEYVDWLGVMEPKGGLPWWTFVNPGVNGPYSQQSSPESNTCSSSSHYRNHSAAGTLTLSRHGSDPGVEQSFSQQPNQSQYGREPSQITTLMSQNETVPPCTGPKYTSVDLPELDTSSHTLHQPRPLTLQHPPSHITSSDEGMKWLYDFYPSGLGESAKDKLEPFREQPVPHCTSTPNKEFLTETTPSCSTIFKSQDRYAITLIAAVSIAQRMGEDTLTYLNKGQFYTLYCKADMSLSPPDQVKTVIALTFLHEQDKGLEYNYWHYWYNLQANPNQRAFDIDRKNCENIQGKPEDIAFNVSSFVWCPEVGAKVVLRINCLSTEFSCQKGIKGLPLHIVMDTYETMNTEQAEAVHRAYCQVKVFRDKGAQRKNKDETKTVVRRMEKFQKQSPSSMDTELDPSLVFHLPCKETVLTPTNTLGPKPFLFLANQLSNLTMADSNSQPSLTPSKVAATSLLSGISEHDTKRTFSTTHSQAEGQLPDQEVGVPARKFARESNRCVITLYARKEEEEVYNALRLDSLSVRDLRLQVSKKYDIPADMIRNVFKSTKKGLLVRVDDEMISQFQDEDDFLIDLQFNSQNGYFDLYIRNC